MSVPSAVLAKLRRIPGLTLIQEVPLSEYTRFGLGGRAEILAESGSPRSFLAAIQAVGAPLCPSVVIGAGTNLIVSDAGFRGVVLRFTGSGVTLSGETLRAEAGAVLQHVFHDVREVVRFVKSELDKKSFHGWRLGDAKHHAIGKPFLVTAS